MIILLLLDWTNFEFDVSIESYLDVLKPSYDNPIILKTLILICKIRRRKIKRSEE
jgi:hypothetical protein